MTIFRLLLFIIATYFLAGSFNLYAADMKADVLETKDGIKIWSVYDDYLPIISVSIIFLDSGYAYDPEGKSGLANITAALLKEGAGKLSSYEYASKLEEMATSIDYNIDEDNFYISIKMLAENLYPSMELLKLALIEPLLAEQDIARVKGQIKTAINKLKENPNYVAGMELKKLLYNNHPYANTQLGKFEDIDKITRKDIENFITSNFTKKNLMISFVGDISKADMKKVVRDTFATLTPSYTTNPLAEVAFAEKEFFKFVDFDVPQSVIVFALPAVLRSDPAFYSSYIMNHALGGGGFESRLMNLIREKNGLAYSVYTYLNTRKKAGLLMGYAATENENVDQVMKLIKQEIQSVHKKGFSKNEILDAKNYVINSFPLNLIENSAIANYLSSMQIENLGADYLNKRNSFIERTTEVEINNSAFDLLNIEKLYMVVVGKKQVKEK